LILAVIFLFDNKKLHPTPLYYQIKIFLHDLFIEINWYFLTFQAVYELISVVNSLEPKIPLF